MRDSPLLEAAFGEVYDSGSTRPVEDLSGDEARFVHLAYYGGDQYPCAPTITGSFAGLVDTDVDPLPSTS